MPIETELKFRFPPQCANQIKALPLLKALSIVEPACNHLYSVYYDTPDFTLKKSRIALRTRMNGTHWIQTIKSGGTIQNGLHQHNEWEHIITDNQPDFSRLTDDHIKHFFSDHRLRESLQPIFITDFYRTLYLLEPTKNFKLEYCIDEGNITIPPNPQTQPESICEIELELISGQTSQLLDFSEVLKKECPCPLVPENKNKAMRGYALLKQQA